MMRRRAFAVACMLFAVAHALGAQVLAELRGHVTDVRSSRPIAGAQLEIVGRMESARTSTDGAFTIRGLEPRTYTVRVRVIGYAVRDADVELVNGRVATLELALEPAVGLSTVVVNANVNSSAAATFDRRAIEASGRRDVGELLGTVPGLVITQAGGPGSATHVSIRGSGSNEVLVLVDGAPLNSLISGDADLSRLSLESVERVVVHTGAQSARYGGRAMAGVIEVETRRPVSEASVVGRAGAWGEQNAAVTLGDVFPLGSMRGGGSITGDYRTVRGDFEYDVPALRGGGTARRVNSDVTSREVTGALSLDGNSLSAKLSGSAETMARGIAGSIVQPSTTGREGQRRQSAGLDAAWHRRAIAWTITGDVTHERATYVDLSPPFGSQYDDTVNATGLTASSVVSVGSDSRSISIGGEARGTDLSSTMLAAGAPKWQRVLGAFGSVRVAHTFDSLGARFDLDAGMRADQSSLLSATMVSPRVVASVSRGLIAASASIGGGYAPPSLADQFFHEGVFVRPNPDLQPERTRDDIEARLSLHDAPVGPARISVEGAAYRANVDGMILWLPDYRFVWSPSNNQVRRSGWELSARAALFGGVDLSGALSHADVVYAGPVLSGQVAYRPRTTANVTLGAGPRVAHIEISDRYVGARRTVPGSELNPLDPYTLTGVRLASAWSWRACAIDASIGIENLLNRPAAMLVDYPFPSRSWTLGLRVRRSDHDRVP